MKRRAHRIPHSAARRKLTAASLTLCAALIMTACGSTDGKKHETTGQPLPPAPSPTASDTTEPKETAKKEAIATYQAYWQEMEKLYGDPTGKSAHLDQYAASAALKNAEADAKSTHARGLINTGDVAVNDLTVTTVDPSGKVANATISSCLDISQWQTVDAKTRKPVSLPDNRLTKYLIVSTVERYPEGWRVTRDDPQGKSC
ncbi:hypothetical protein [Streptomyces crystallinus]|uniref:Secreted protein/lipoprotein n=1 Tax=Streptomyces crystallinus TaxID=68191 RepID=A0ABP3RJK8_9ACTN